VAQRESRRARPRARVPETDGAVGVDPPRTRNRPRPYPRPHPDVLAAVGAVRAALDALARERLAVDPPDPAALRGASCHPGDVASALGDRMLATLAARLPRPLCCLPAQAADSPLARLAEGFALTLLETGILALAWAAAIDGVCGSLVGLLLDDREREQPSVELAMAVLAPGNPTDPAFLGAVAPGSPLLTRGLIRLQPPDPATPHGQRAVGRQALALDPLILWALHGDRLLPVALASVARVPSAPRATARPDDEAEAAPSPVLAALLDAAARDDDAPRALLLAGTDRQATRAAAEGVAARLGRPLLVIDGERVAARDDGAVLARGLLALSVARGLTPCIEGAEALLAPALPYAAAHHEMLRAYPAPVLLLGGDDEAAIPVGGGIARVVVPAPSVRERAEQWRAAADASGIAADDDTVRALAETSGLSGPDIEEAARATVAEAVARRGLARGTDLQRAARLAVRARATDITLVAPRASWADLVLPEDRLRLLRRLCARVRHRSQVREDWTIGTATLPGVTALFSGAPGTGKSLAAEVVAHDLGLDLCKIDLSQTVSKYIGETEKALGRLFDAAERGGVLLVFDEADALFGKRSAVKDSHDRYANLETSYLLQRLERFSGLAILTSNLGANLDEAFTRRISVGVDFPLPGPAERLSLWLRALGQAPTGADLNLSLLAERLELSGGEILNVAIGAAYLAAAEGGPIDMARVAEALRGELGKMGRLVEPYLARVAAPVPAAPAPAPVAPVPSPPPAALSLPGRADPSTGTERPAGTKRLAGADPSMGTARPADAGATTGTPVPAAEARPAPVQKSGRADGGETSGGRSPGGGPEGAPGPDSGGHGAMTQPTPTSPDPTTVPPRPAPSGLHRGGSYASEGVRGPRPPDRRPGS